jgi:hypothetical protein
MQVPNASQNPLDTRVLRRNFGVPTNQHLAVSPYYHAVPSGYHTNIPPLGAENPVGRNRLIRA